MSVPIIVKVIPVSSPVEPIHTLAAPATPPCLRRDLGRY
jgi:hypothetical protein